MIPTLAKTLDPVTRSIQKRLPEISHKTDAIGRSNSQTTLSLMSLTMLNGQSPHRIARQVLAEIERRRMALAEAQVEYAKLTSEQTETDPRPDVAEAEERLRAFNISQMEAKVSGAIKDIAVLIAAYDGIAATHGINNWTEEDFERQEDWHHVRRGFELLYRNIIECGRGKEATIEYLQQFGVHIQVALHEVMGYITTIEEGIRAGQRPDASSLEDFLDAMAAKYRHCVAVATRRLFGADTVVRNDFMTDVRGVD